MGIICVSLDNVYFSPVGQSSTLWCPLLPLTSGRGLRPLTVRQKWDWLGKALCRHCRRQTGNQNDTLGTFDSFSSLTIVLCLILKAPSINLSASAGDGCFSSCVRLQTFTASTCCPLVTRCNLFIFHSCHRWPACVLSPLILLCTVVPERGPL